MTSLHRRTLIIGLCSAAVVPMGARAQTTERVYRVGYLTPGPGPGGSRPLLDLLIAALRERGWMVGRNLIIEIRDTRGDPVRAEALAKELVQARADLIVTSATGTAMAAHRATTVVPIVMITSGVPVEGGLAKSLARPGGNVTGMTIYAGGFGLWGNTWNCFANWCRHCESWASYGATRRPPTGWNKWLRRPTNCGERRTH